MEIGTFSEAQFHFQLSSISITKSNVWPVFLCKEDLDYWDEQSVLAAGNARI